MSPDGTTNLAVKDIINALKFLNKVSPAFGGSYSKITVAGQSSGANMIRALLAVPSASSLFMSAILQSDPMVSRRLVRKSVLRTNYLRRIMDSWLPPSNRHYKTHLMASLVVMPPIQLALITYL